LRRLLGASALCLTLSVLGSAATLITGKGTATGLLPISGRPVNFDGQTPNSDFSRLAYDSVGVLSSAATNGTPALAEVPFSTHVTPATKIKSLEIVGNGGIDNLQFLSASASMPEPASYALFGAGLVGIGALAVKKRNEN
jgi:hypothetical protein